MNPRYQEFPPSPRETIARFEASLGEPPALDPAEQAIAWLVENRGQVPEVTEGDMLGFVVLVKGTAELMIQSTASIEKDNVAMAKYARPAACLYIEVENFDDLLKRLGTVPVVVPIRTTFYGMKEIGVREPGGNIVLFAAKAEQAAAP